jgi:ubiquinone/menaquinone biosynthesis C-methylase UbiE
VARRAERSEFEKAGPVARALRAALVNPFANYAPAGLIRWLLRVTKSELAAANWADPGGWQSMVISYEGRCRQWADKVLVGGGTIPKALRNRRRLAGRILTSLMDACPHQPAEVVCVGAGPGIIIIDALKQSRNRARATLIDLSDAAHGYAKDLAKRHGVHDRVRFITGDVRQIARYLDSRVDIVDMIGICEYLQDDQVVSIVQTLAAVMPAGGTVVLNSLSDRHGTDRFFRRVFGLHLNHRSVEKLSRLMHEAGLKTLEALGEPLGVYHIITARKQP